MTKASKNIAKKLSMLDASMVFYITSFYYDRSVFVYNPVSLRLNYNLVQCAHKKRKKKLDKMAIIGYAII